MKKKCRAQKRPIFIYKESCIFMFCKSSEMHELVKKQPKVKFNIWIDMQMNFVLFRFILKITPTRVTFPLIEQC